MTPAHYKIGIGATAELGLRVSVAALVRVLFKNPGDGEVMLALERKATLHETEGGRAIAVKSQPFGGAIRILDVNKLRDSIGEFHFDSEHSRAERDFRIFIRPADWSAVREFCLHHLNCDDDPVLETDPARELAEEFAAALQVSLMPPQFDCNPIATLAENEPSPTENYYAKGAPTVRLYRIFEVSITDSLLGEAMLKSSESVSNQRLHELALQDFENGGHGWTNAILALPLKRLSECNFSIPSDVWNASITFEENLLDETVSTILDGMFAPKYQRLA